MADPVRGLVVEALARLRWGVPAAFDRLGRKLAGFPIRIEVGPEAFGVEASAGGIRVVAPPAAPVVMLRTDRATLNDLLDARLDLHRAIVEDRLYLLGTIHDLRRLLGALDVFLHGAVRARGFEALRQRLEGP